MEIKRELIELYEKLGKYFVNHKNSLPSNDFLRKFKVNNFIEQSFDYGDYKIFLTIMKGENKK